MPACHPWPYHSFQKPGWEPQFITSTQAAGTTCLWGSSRNRQTDAWPRQFPGPAVFATKALWGGKLADLQPAQQQAFTQDSNDFLLSEGSVGSGPCVLPLAHHASWVAQMSCQGLGPGLELPVSVVSGHHQYLCMSVEGPSSAHSGSSQLPTALST